ncbi:MAG: tetratricopeptide repeat protein [Myxococcota bacterium]|nr:tetratricopeptide repeat protein [Myxococcota bacterium]
MTLEVWLPGIIVLALGALVGVIVVKLARRAGVATDRDMTLRDLEERVEHTVNQLRDLQLQEARIEPAFYTEQRAELEARAASALRERDDVLSGKDVIKSGPDRPKRAVAEGEVSPAVAWLDARPWARTLAWVLGVGIVGGILIASVAIEQKPREQTSGPMAGRPAPDANDVQQLLAHARQMLASQQFEEAQTTIARVRRIAPDNQMAMVYEAVLMAAAGDVNGANSRLDSITNDNPKLPDAWLFRGMLAMQAGNTERMRESFTQFVAVAPESPQRERIRAMLQAQPQ